MIKGIPAPYAVFRLYFCSLCAVAVSLYSPISLAICFALKALALIVIVPVIVIGAVYLVLDLVGSLPSVV